MVEETREVSQAVVRDMFVQLMHRLRIHRSLKPEALALERAMKVANSAQSEYRHNVKRPPRQKQQRKRKLPFARGVQLALRQWNQVYVCANCNTCVASPLGELWEEDHAVVVELEDSKDRENNLSFTKGCNVKGAEESMVIKSSDEHWLYQVKLVFCYGCDHALGVNVQSVAWRQDGNQVLRAIPESKGESPIPLSIDEKILFETLHQSWCNAKLKRKIDVESEDDRSTVIREYLDTSMDSDSGVYVAGLRRSFGGNKSKISAPKPKFFKDNSHRISYLRLDEDAPDVCLGVLELGQIVICSRYLLLKQYRSLYSRCEPRSQLILCAHESEAGRECNNILCETADLLSLRRNWCVRRGKLRFSSCVTVLRT